jgi:hypothetical protein
MAKKAVFSGDDDDDYHLSWVTNSCNLQRSSHKLEGAFRKMSNSKHRFHDHLSGPRQETSTEISE